MNDESIFSEALNKRIPAEREAFVNAACGDDLAQRRRIEELLASHAQSNSLLDQGLAPHNQLGSTLDAKGLMGQDPHQQIGRYRLLHLLGEGGMGTVYLAEQQQPVKRRVAVKIIKQGMNSDQFIARFEAERQALAMMDHPNIAKVLDGGCTEEGRPFFVMELVKGIPITEFCDQNKLTTQERLGLFIQVCQAVQHAHQKGIIHRDLKPSNVMVAMYDDHPVPKVIDFGVAKATHQPLTEQTLYTVPGQIVGTWEYMSPEQAILNQLDVDTRTDIYSLGVILYELLTGHTPLDLQSLRPEALEERLRRIREQEPSRPSLKVSSLGQQAGSLATYRGTQVASLAKSLRGDLDWIVMKAIEKDRSKRYETANGFAAEIQRFLHDEPLSFRPPSTWEQFGRFYRRNRVVGNTVLASIATLSVGLIFALLSRADAMNQKKEADRISQQLLNERSIKDGVLRQLSLELIEKALVHAQNADEPKMESALADAIRSGASVEWEDILRGQLYLYGKDTGKAIVFLECAVARNPLNVTANGMLATAYMFHGYYEKFVTQVDRVKHMVANTEFDQLFAGAGLTMYEDPTALELVQDALTVRPMPLGLAIEAQTLGHLALDTGDRQTALRAIRKIKAAREFLPDNRFVRMIDVSLHHTAFNIGVEGIDNRVVLRTIEDAGDMGTYSIGHYVNAMTYSDLEMPVEAEQAYKVSAENGNWWSIPVWELCGQGRFDDAAEFLQRMREKSDIGLSTKLLGQQWIDIIKGEEVDRADLVNRALISNQRASQAPDDGVAQHENSWSLELLLMSGLYDEAREVYGETEVVLSFDQEVFPFCLSVEPKDPRILSLVQTSAHAKAQIYYSYGLAELAQGNRSAALDFFDKAVNSKFFFYDYYHKAKALRSLIRQGHEFPSFRTAVLQ